MIKKPSSTVKIQGNTYPVKDQLKALGARWDAESKCWTIASHLREQAEQIVSGAGPKKPYASRSSSGFRSRESKRDQECELCGRNRYTCGHCIGW